MNKAKHPGYLQATAFASQLAPAIIGVCSFMLLVRVVESELLGQYIMFMSAVVLFEMIKSGGLQSALVMRLSGRTPQEQLQTIGSAYWLGGVISVGLSLVLSVVWFSKIFAAQPGIQIFCGWYACLGIITLPLHIAEAKAVASQKLNFLLTLRITQSTNSLLIAGYAWLSGGGLKEFATIHLLFNAGLMTAVVLLGKTNPLHIRYKIANEVRELYKLIRYTLATLATTNLLKTADTFLIGSLLGPGAVATYAIPLKLTELFEIPLRSLGTTAFPQLASANNAKSKSLFKKLYVQYLSWAYLLYIPALVIAFAIAPLLITTLGGTKYVATVTVFRIFLLYGMLLPADRLSGISLDALQKPQKNFVKVLCMALVNLLGDVVAIRLTGRLEWVAFASVLNVATGIAVGNWLLKKEGIFKKENIWNQCVGYSKFFVQDNLKRLRPKVA